MTKNGQMAWRFMSWERRVGLGRADLGFILRAEVRIPSTTNKVSVQRWGESVLAKGQGCSFYHV